jgi:hypothetical protein
VRPNAPPELIDDHDLSVGITNRQPARLRRPRQLHQLKRRLRPRREHPQRHRPPQMIQRPRGDLPVCAGCVAELAARRDQRRGRRSVHARVSKRLKFPDPRAPVRARRREALPVRRQRQARGDLSKARQYEP